MLNLHSQHKAPHSLRFTVTLLRLVVGLDLFYWAFSQINPALTLQLNSGKALGSLVDLISVPSRLVWLMPFAEWAIFIVGIGLILGLATRLLSILGIGLIGWIYLAGINFASLNFAQLINQQVIIVLCLFVFIFAHAGNYLGLDKFIHFSFRPKK